MTKLIKTFCKDEQGATAIEYGLIAAGMGIAMITLASHVGDEIKLMFEHLRGLLRSLSIRVPAS